jgi:hypothetical protein
MKRLPKIELEIKMHRNKERYYVSKKGNVNPVFHQTLQTTQLSYKAATRVLRQITAELEASRPRIR